MIDVLSNYGNEILRGLLGTIMILVIGCLIGTPVGAAMAFLLISPKRYLRWPSRSYVEVIRNTPFLIQAMLLFALLGVMRLRIDPMIIGTTSVAIYTTAYMAEIVRGALKAIPKGQWEAANALGLRSIRAFRLVIFPQLLPSALPASINLFGTVAKETAFLSAVSVAELTFAGQVVIAQTFKVFEVWAIIGTLYLCLILLILAAAKWLDRGLKWAQHT
jgi:His/Glu/Gln/Arg/opine family amino acid ABC transporter permease subunit